MNLHVKVILYYYNTTLIILQLVVPYCVTNAIGITLICVRVDRHKHIGYLFTNYLEQDRETSLVLRGDIFIIISGNSVLF